jgi:hypothetical protein
MNLVSLLILPLVITQRHNTAARYAIAAVALAILLAAIAFSKRRSEGVGGAAPEGEPVEVMAGAPAAAAAVPSAQTRASLSEAIDQWVVDLGQEENDLRDRLLEVKGRLQSPSSAPAVGPPGGST